MKVGFVNIFGKPNAGKSTLLNLLMGEKLAIVSPKVQTTRHRIKGILSEKDYQLIISDTPGIIEPKYKLHEKMMQAVRSSLEDADLALLITDVNEQPDESDAIFSTLRLKVAGVVLLNKCDRATPERIEKMTAFYNEKKYCKKVIAISALNPKDKQKLINEILPLLKDGDPFYGEDEITDLPTRFFVSEMIREKVFELFDEEIPYHTAVLVHEYKEKTTLIKIRADIIVQRETQKGIIIGDGGKMIKKIGTEARKAIEAFLQQKVYLELFVKVRPKWRENEVFLREYGYK